MHAVVERSPCIGIQMRLPQVDYFVSLTLFCLQAKIILNIKIKENHGN